LIPHIDEKKYVSHRFCSLIFLPAVQLGIKDSITPYVLSALLVLNVFLYILRKRPLSISLICGAFISGYILVHALLTMGVYDRFLKIAIFQSVIRWSNLLLGIVFIVIGIVHLRDWWMLKKNKDADLNISLREEAGLISEKAKVKTFLSIAAVFFIGQVVALLGSGWAPDKNFYVNLEYAVEGNQIGSMLAFTFAYSFFSAWLLWFLWIFVVSVRLKNKEFWVKNVSLLKIILSSIFLSVGIGISYLSLK
jgi:hypothetical protein